MGDSANEAISMDSLTIQTSVNKHSEMYCNSGQSPSVEASLSAIEGSPTSMLDDPDGPREPLEQAELSRCWELESGDQIVDVRGRLKANVGFWQHTLRPPPWIIDCITDSYKLPLRTVPGPFFRKIQDSVLKNVDFVAEAIKELEFNQCERIDKQPHICSPLSVVENGKGKCRLFINLRYLNQFLWKDKFKYEDIRIAMLMFQKDDYMFLFDLKSGYHHVKIYETHRRYLGFQWFCEERVQFFVFIALPFGLESTACYAFTKLLLRHLVKYWGMQGF